MKMLPTKMVLATWAALATMMVAEAAYGASKAGKVDRRRVEPQSNEARAGGRVIGRDPDPFIRGELLRHYNSGWRD